MHIHLHTGTSTCGNSVEKYDLLLLFFCFVFSSWTILTGALGQQLQRCQKVLTVWQVYDKCAGSLTERLQALQSDATSVLSSTPGQDNTVKLFTVKIENVQVR